MVKNNQPAKMGKPWSFLLALPMADKRIIIFSQIQRYLYGMIYIYGYKIQL
jgi:hypothetical protein